MPLGLTVVASVTDAAIDKNIFRFGACSLDVAKQTTFIILNEEMNDIMKKVKSLEESGLLIKDVSETLKKWDSKHNGWFFSKLLGALAASLLENLWPGKDTIRAGEGMIRADQNF